MKIFKFVLAALAALALWKAAQVLVLGKPNVPAKALAEWHAEERSKLPRHLDDDLSQVDVGYDWVESSNRDPGRTRFWLETYVLKTGLVDEPVRLARIARAKQDITARVCASEMHKKILDLNMAVDVTIQIPAEYTHETMSITRQTCGA